MKRLILVIMLIPMSLFSQIKKDTTLAYEYFQKGDSLSVLAQYEESIEQFDLAAEAYKKCGLWDRYVNSINKSAESEWRFQRLGNSLKKSLLALKESEIYLGLRSEQAADTYANIGIYYGLQIQHDSALVYFERSLEIQKELFTEVHEKVAKNYSNLGLTAGNTRQYKKAIDYLHKCRLIQEELVPGSLDLSKTYVNLAFYYEAQNYYIEAEKFTRKSLAIREKLLPNDHPSIGNSLSHLASVFERLGQYDLALATNLKSYRIFQKTVGEKHYLTSQSLKQISVNYIKKEDYDKALFYYRKDKKIVEELYGKQGSSYINTCYGIGVVFFEMKNYDSAQHYFNKALTIRNENPGVGNSFLLAALAEICTKRKDFSKAIKLYKEAIEVANSLDRYRGAAVFSNGMAGVYLELDLYDSALLTLEKAKTFNFKNEHGLKIPFDFRVLLKTKHRKSETLYKLYEKENELSVGLASFKNYLVCDSLIQVMRRHRNTYEDKVSFSKIVREVYEGAIDMALTLYYDSGDEVYLEQINFLVERSKNSTLRNALSDVHSKKFVNLPDSIIRLERGIKNDRIYTISKINKIQATDDKSETDRLKDDLFHINRKYDSLTSYVEKRFPNYYKLKYNDDIIGISEVRKNLRKSNAILQYFEGDKNITLLVISQQENYVYSIPIDESLHDNIESFSKNLKKEPHSQSAYQSYKEYGTLAYSLYSKLLVEPISNLSDEINELIIIPDGELSYLPFDLLLTEAVNTDYIDYRSLSYLIKNYNIRYAYSSTLLFDKPQGKSLTTTDLMSFAPTYSSEYVDSLTLIRRGKYRDAIVPLKWNVKEAKAVNEYAEGDSFLDNLATETAFKQYANNYNVLHLAMHAFVDDKNPMLSRLVFTPNQDSIEDGYLHAFELYNMKLDAELVVLSACETGYGKLVKGEGVMSLARAFSYAGVPSIVMSHWQVDDKSTSELMKLFYENLSLGMRKTEALRKAKLDFLENADIKLSLPFYWGSFTLVGDDGPLVFEKDNKWLYAVIGAMFLALAISFIIIRKYLPSITRL